MKTNAPIVAALIKKYLVLPLAGLALCSCSTTGSSTPNLELLEPGPAAAASFITVADSKELDAIAPRKVRLAALHKTPIVKTVAGNGLDRPMPGSSATLASRKTTSNRVNSKSRGIGRAAETFAVLSYHRVGADRSRYTVSPEAFAEQMRFLLANGYHTLTTHELERFFAGENLPEKSVLLTIDDGHRSSFEQVHQILNRYGFNAVYYPYSDFINNGGLSSSMMKGMLETGLVEFGLHSKTHAALTVKKDFETEKEYQDRILFELVEPALRIRRITGAAPNSIAYPYGKINRQVESWIRSQGVALGFTVNCALNNRNTNPLRLNRCTIWNGDDEDMFAAKLERPNVALARLERGESSVVKSAPPEFLGHLADREFFKGIPIEPFAAYFVDPEGERLSYAISGLPAGLNIDEKTGEISGTPESSARVADAVIKATDETGSIARSNRFSMVVY